MIQTADERRIAPRGVGKYLAQIAIVFAVQFAAGKLGDALAIINSGGIGPVWPASGVALAALLLFGYQVWPGVAAGAFLLAFLSPIPHIAAVVYAAGTTLAALTGTFLLRRVVNFDHSLSRLRDALGLIVFGAFGSSIVSACVGVSLLYAAHVRGWSGFGPAWMIYWLGDSMGVLLVTPLVLTFPNLLRIRPRVRIAEFAALLLLLTVACFIVFGHLPLISVKLHVLAFAVLPFVIWAAIRFGVSGATLSTLLIAIIATAETAVGSGPFAQNTPFTNAVLLDVFFAVLSVSGMTLAAVIAEREQAERERERLVRGQAAMEARLRLATIVESSDDAIIGKDMDGIITDWNKGAERLYGYSAGEVVGKPISLLVPPDRSGDFADIVGKHDIINHYETVHQRKDDTRIEVSMTMSPIRDTEGRIVGASVVGRDISERKRREAILRESEERFRLAAQAGKMYAYEWDVATDMVMRSEEHVNVLGFSDQAKQLTRQQLLARVHPDDRALFSGSVDHLTPENPTTQISYRMFRPDGSVVWLEKSARAFFDEQGGMLRVIGMVADITERKRAEEALRESEARLRLAAQAGKMYAFEWDVATDVMVRSSEYVNVLGASEPRTLTHQQAMEKVHPDDREKLVAAVDRHSLENPTVNVAYRVLLPGKSPIWVKSSGRAFFDGEGRMLRVIGMVADVTDQKLAEEALRSSEERLRLAQKAARIGTFERNLRTGVNTWTPEMESMYGLPPGGFGQTRTAFENLVHPDDRAEVMKLVDEALKTGQPTHGEWRVVWPDESVHWIAGRWQVLMEESGEPSRVVGVDMDITERKLGEAALANVSRKLIEAQEQERTRIGRELHDDIGQRLAMLVIELQQLQEYPADLSEVRRRMGEVKKRTSDIADDIQSLSHELHSAKLQYLGIAGAVRGFCREFGEQQKVEIDFQTYDVPDPLSGDISLCLFRVLQEALHNSAKHSGVRHFEVRLWGTSVEIHLTVRDSGVGFDTEASKESRGIGLISMGERLKLLKGTLSIESLPERGTTIHARVPLSSGSDSMRAAG